MAIDRFKKVYAALDAATAAGQPLRGVGLSVGISKVSGSADALIAFQESSEMLVTDNTRQTRTIGVRLISLSVDAPRSKTNLRAAVDALDAAESIRVFDITGVSVELEEGLSAPEGMFVATQVASIR